MIEAEQRTVATEMAQAEPRVGRPVMPKDYGVPESEEGLLPWGHVTERLSAAMNYWIGTCRPDGRPHVSPIWGVWLDGVLFFDGSPDTRRGKNIASNPNITVNLESGSDVVILEGVAEDITPDLELRTRLSQVYTAKYADSGYSPGPETWEQGIYRVRPRRVLAWTTFPIDCTRWEF